jgi:hypothetical protein
MRNRWKRRALVAIALLVSTLCFSLAGENAKLELVRQGVSRYSICLSAEASPSEKHGAEELRRFLEEMSGARLPLLTGDSPVPELAILVGRSPQTDSLQPPLAIDALGDEGFVLRTVGKRLVIAGGRKRGTMYGVYSFLEKLGCRWFAPGVQKIPRLKNITVQALNESHRPSFEYREPFFTEAFDRDWAARNKANGASMKLDEPSGGKVTYYPFVHSFYTMIPPEKYFDSHPEYFSLIDGKRRHERGQLCLTNPDLLKESVKNVLGWIREHPEAGIYSVSQNDWTGWCECDRCQRVEREEGGVHSGPMLRFVNAVAEEIEKVYPDKLIDTLAYWYTEEPPSKVRPRKNVRIRLCPIGVCEAHPYEQCPRNAYFMKNLKAWSKITSQLYIWHYNTNFAHYLSPFPDFDELAADIPMYSRNGVVGLFMEGAYPEGGGGENAELRSYVMSRLMWDARTDAAEAVREFIEGVYGEAAPAMKEYFELQHRQVRFPPAGAGNHLQIFMHTGAPYLSGDFISRSRAVLARALDSADTEAARKRVRHALLSIEYVDLMQGRGHVIRDGKFAPADAEGLRRRYGRFIEEIRGVGMGRLRESTPLADDEKAYYKSLESYDVTTLENGRWLVDISPGLNGRILRLVEKKTGRDLLLAADSGQFSYPNTGGAVVSVYPDYHSRQALTLNWKVESANSREAVLLGTAENGLTVRHSIALREDGGIRMKTTADNPGAGEISAAIQSRFELDAGQSGSRSISFKRRDGMVWERTLSENDRDPSAAENFAGDGMPDGEIRLSMGGANSIFRIPASPGGRAYANWGLRTAGSITLGFWSEQKKLKKGESLSLEVSIY